MTSIAIDDDKLRALLKQALLELLQEKNDLLYEVLAEVLEEIGLVAAIREGRADPNVDVATVLEALERDT